MVAWIALGFSLATLAILIWDKFLRRAKFEVQADWILSASEPVLRFVIFNVGHNKGTVRELRLKERAMPEGRGWTPYEQVLKHLPVVLDANEGSPAFLIQVPTRAHDVFEDALRTGRIDALEVENARKDISVFPIPALYEAQRNAETNAGPDLAKTTP